MSNALAQTSGGGIERIADGFAGNEQFHSAVLLTAGGIIVRGYRQTIAKALDETELVDTPCCTR